MDAMAIGIIVFGIIFVIGGVIVSHFATKASYRDADEANKLQKK